MKASFHAQPFLDFGGWTANWLQQQLSIPEIYELKIAVAWVKRSALSRLEDQLKVFRNRGGISSVIIGIDEGGATIQGLRLALELFDTAYIFHDPSSRTYHPKVYIASGPETAELLIGSNNMTAGGLYSNYEAALQCSLSLAEVEDSALLAQVADWFELLCADANVCKQLTIELLETLIHDPRYIIGDESRPTRERRNIEGVRDGIINDSPGKSVFNVPPYLRGVMASIPPAPPRLVRHTEIHRRRDPLIKPAAQTTQRPSALQRKQPLIWWKQMSRSDAQQPRRVNTNPTGNLKLTKAGHDIDIETYFREEMFGDLAWVSEQTARGPRESTEATFDVVIDGVSVDQHSFKVDHALFRIADQNNVPTWLHWGSLMPLLLQTDYTGTWVIIRRRTDGTYQLEISRYEPPQM